MLGFITQAQAIMNVVGGAPVMPAGAKTIIENLRAAKSMIPGEMGGIFAQILTDGPGALLQNPMAAITGQLQGQLGGLLSQVQGIANGNFDGLISAISGTTGLQGALGSLSSVTSALSGLTQPLQGAFGLMDAIGHANIVSMLGEHLPAGLGIEQALGPLLQNSALSSMSGQVASMAAAVGAGTIDPVAAALRVTGMTRSINDVLDASHNAFSTIQGAAVNIAQAAGAVSLITSGPAAFAPIAAMLIRPEFAGQISAAMAEQVRPAELPTDISHGDDRDWS